MNRRRFLGGVAAAAATTILPSGVMICADDSPVALVVDNLAQLHRYKDAEQFAAFVDALMRQISVSMGVRYELLALDYERELDDGKD